MRDSELIAERAQADLLQKVHDFLAERDISEVTFGNMAAHNSSIVERLRHGRVTFRLGKQIEEFITRQRGAATDAS